MHPSHASAAESRAHFTFLPEDKLSGIHFPVEFYELQNVLLAALARVHTGAQHINYTHTGSYFAAAHNLCPTTHFSHANELPAAHTQ
jgi:hypothetical protein